MRYIDDFELGSTDEDPYSRPAERPVFFRELVIWAAIPLIIIAQVFAPTWLDTVLTIGVLLLAAWYGRMLHGHH